MNEKYKQNFIHAGSIAREVRAYGKSLIHKGASYNETIDKIHKKIRDLKAIPAFPPQIAINHVAAHFLPQPDEDIEFRDDIVKLDVGVCYLGAIGDCAVTVDLSGKYQALIDAAESALLAAEKIITVGLPVNKIGKIIEQTVSEHNLKVVRNLSGHGLGYYKIHTPPQIPNIEGHSTAVIKAGMTFAIEPFVTNGKGMIFETKDPTIFSFASDHNIPLGINRALLRKIKSFNGLPFAIHDLIEDSFPLADVRENIKLLLKAGIIAGYGPLIEAAEGMVAQAENSVLVDNNGKVIITTR